MGALIVLEQLVAEEGPVVEDEAVTAWEAMTTEAPVILEEVESKGEAILNDLEQAFGEGEVGETATSCEAQTANQADAIKLQERASELQQMRAPWEAQNGTTSVIRGQDPVTGEIRDFISTEGETMPEEWEGQLGPNEQFIEGEGHAEETILNSEETSGFDLSSGGTSRGVCRDTCEPLLQENGFSLGGESSRVMPQNTPYRTFWK